MPELQRSWRENCADFPVARTFPAARRTVFCAKTEVSRLPRDMRPTARCARVRTGRTLPPSEAGRGGNCRTVPPSQATSDSTDPITAPSSTAWDKSYMRLI